MKRRKFITDSSLYAFSVGVFGTVSWNGRSFVGDSPTTSDILGPFYRPGAPIRSSLITTDSKGEAVALAGTVFDKDGSTPLSDTLVEIWHADHKGEYDNTSMDFRYRAGLRTDKEGRYLFKTMLPPPYHAGQTMRPSHIHLRISNSNKQDLITQIYFKGDPYLDKDPSSAMPLSATRILPVMKKGNQSEVIFNVVLRDQYLLEPGAFQKIAGLYSMGNDKWNAEFVKSDDLLVMKSNGQYNEAFVYKGNNEFEGGLGFTKLKFELTTTETKVTISSRYRGNETRVEQGVRILNYTE